jgi:hypothetical protein
MGNVCLVVSAALVWTTILSPAKASLTSQAAPGLQFRGAQRPLHAAVAAGPLDLAVKTGDNVSLFVDVTPNANIHVYAPGAKDYIPITVKVDPQPKVKLGKLTYPKSEMMTFADEKVPVFQKPFRLTQQVTLNESAVSGTKVAIAGTVQYQACDDRVCYAPESAPITWTVTVR